MSSLALSFNEVKFNPVVRDNGQIYLTAGELAQALDYKSVKSVSNLYNANKDEFTDSMTQIIESVTAGNIEVTDSVTSKQTRNLKKKVRIFSLRGCHLIAMFARTAVAKQFRKWVLDILDKEVGAPVARTHKSERTPLHDAHALLVAKTKHLNSSEAWKIINQRFGTNHIDEIPYNMIPVAVEYVHHLIAMYSGAEKKEQGSLFDKDAYELVRKLTEAVIIENDEIVPVLLAVKMLDVKKFAYYSHLVVKANEAARDVARLLDFRNLQNEPLIDADCSVIAMSNGQRFLARPNWFNCPA
ncbi:BRO family protein [Acinetobacter baumannii]|uniref:BRO-N domain-containing protein n=3 Tax=Acinetobacter baumannii TaxID=470 RepID=UPI0002BA41B7|nr:BRO family protein [Acinetobacter baumannii]EKT8993271.1 alpha/beta hydrolase [Acinetobacter baumannii]EKU0555056.1 alpha/beta hydrolase [Acinetobacter baumannii]EKU0684719.1 alpha/beta hydrolase [Acinetobacter baumannii]EKU0705644.1 alpha/beta hydrolase [Acinetobacter baumannii]EKU2464313.1 alpha/beta hydrolase [Acinetobacter baumannii]